MSEIGGGGGTSVYVSVCFPRDISKNDAARISKHDIEMLHGVSWKSVYVWVKRSKTNKNITGMDPYTFVSADLV